jgi:hypothetical protein
VSKQHNEYSLVYKPHAKHFVNPRRECFEAFARLSDSPAIMDMIEKARLGILDGHVPDPKYVYSFRPYFYPGKMLIKLTHKLKPCIHVQPPIIHGAAGV